MLIIFSGLVLAGSCDIDVELPTEKVTVYATFPGSLGYWNVDISNVLGDYDVSNILYPGWCVEQDTYLIDDLFYNVTLYSSYDPDLAAKCLECVDEDWDMVNYILNHKKGSNGAVQEAVWYFVNGGHYPTNSDAIDMVEDALANGEGFCPQTGESLAVIAYAGEEIQRGIIEIKKREVCEYDCLIPDSLNDTEKESYPADHDLQDILDGKGFGLDIETDQTNYQIWHFDSEEIEVEIEFLGNIAGYNNVFGYYFDSDPTTFIPLFATKPHSDYPGVPLVSVGDTFTTTLIKNGGENIGFSIDSQRLTGETVQYFTEIALNPITEVVKDHAVTFDLCDNRYVIAFEDKETHIDYDDVVVSLKVLECGGECESNITIYQDATQRSWYPNDQTIYIADEYGFCDTNLYGDEVCVIEERGNYVFSGETLAFYVIVEDEDGEGIEDVVLENFGGCVEISPLGDSEVNTYTGGAYSNWEDYAEAKFGVAWDAGDMELYRCKLIVNEDTGIHQIRIDVEDEEGCEASDIKEYIRFNPPLNISVGGGVDFGSVMSGSIATSKDPVRLINGGGAVMDMYIASDDYFVDPGNEEAICGDANGIKYDQFSYYATKGSINSGNNDNSWFGLGEDSEICAARADEFTPLPSHSGEIADMCRIINHGEDGSFLNAHDYMSVLFRLDIPNPCEGAFTDGKFHFVGRAV